MATQTHIPSELTNDDKALLFQILDTKLNSIILYVLLHGIYTGILAVTLWNIFINKCWPIRRAVVVIIILLYVLITISVGAHWSYMHFAFIENGQNYWTVYLILQSTNAATWVMNIVASISTILADLYMIWCCWMVWGQHWLVVLLPIFSLVSAIISKAMTVYYDKVNLVSPLWKIFMMLYISLSLVTTLSCTLLIIYRIVAVTGIRHRALALQRELHPHSSLVGQQQDIHTPEMTVMKSSVFAVDIEAQLEQLVISVEQDTVYFISHKLGCWDVKCHASQHSQYQDLQLSVQNLIEYTHSNKWKHSEGARQLMSNI
ncbi:hypothetical protein ARMGADRAFT_1144072 [Armillaria gallica]|uniref:Uncharacterized protein n=1 Tax=Armillaria gallica TaxID=47427 RepID=A0A2H3CZY8_ARMGA|nr:hypothetical protein ARMGADRAFT_1144072 [Armillaria gallica]